MIDARAMDLSAAWKRQVMLLIFLMLAMLVLYYPSFESIVAIWSRSDTFAHGFIIVPISLWLIWRIRDQVLATEPKANYLGIPILLLLGLVWLLANYIGVLAAEQLAAVMMLLVLVFTTLGWRSTTTMAFPLLFVLLAVPIGEELTPNLIDFTADFTVAMIQMVGIPIYREGNFFQLPTGNWSVVAACSGVRYLIASVTLGVLYAYLNYQSPVKRGLFVVAAFVVPVIANGLRAFMIVMIGHFSDMQLATGVDHLIYGWLFFGIVIGIMFYIGSFWRDDFENVPKYGFNLKLGDLDCNSGTAKLTALLAAVVLIALPLKLHFDTHKLDLSKVTEIQVPVPAGWEIQQQAVPAWTPAYHGLDREFTAVYENSTGQQVLLYVGYYADQRQDAELDNFNNVLVAEKDETWRLVNERSQALPLEQGSLRAPLVSLTSTQNRLLATYFFYVADELVTNKYQTKLLQARVKLLGGHNDGAVIVISTNNQEANDFDNALLKEFAAAVLPQLKTALDAMEPGS